MSDSTTVAERLRFFIRHSGLSVSRFSKELGVPQPTMSSYLNCHREPGIMFLVKLKERHPDLNLNWVVSGIGNMLNDTDSRYEELMLKYYNLVEDQVTLCKKIIQMRDDQIKQ